MPINEQKVVERILQLENKIDDFRDELKGEMRENKDDILSAIDSAMKKMADVDEEQVMTRATLDRHQDEIDSNKKDITKVQKVLKMT